MNPSQSPHPFFSFAAFGYLLALALLPADGQPEFSQIVLLSKDQGAETWTPRGALPALTPEVKANTTPRDYLDFLVDAANPVIAALQTNTPVDFEAALAELLVNNLKVVNGQLVAID